MHIGPGLLTRSILDTGVKRIAAIEKDERFLPTLTVCRQAGQGSRMNVSVVDKVLYI